MNHCPHAIYDADGNLINRADIFAWAVERRAELEYKLSEYLKAVEARADVYLTVDEDILAMRDKLECRFPTKIRKPSELVDEL